MKQNAIQFLSSVAISASYIFIPPFGQRIRSERHSNWNNWSHLRVDRFYFIISFQPRVRCLRSKILFSATFFSFTLAQVFSQLFPMQVLLGCSWAFLYVGSLRYLMRRNVEKATSTGMLGSVINLAAVSGALLGRMISEFLGFRTSTYTAAALAATGSFLFIAGNDSSPSETTKYLK